MLKSDFPLQNSRVADSQRFSKFPGVAFWLFQLLFFPALCPAPLPGLSRLLAALALLAAVYYFPSEAQRRRYRRVPAVQRQRGTGSALHRKPGDAFLQLHIGIRPRHRLPGPPRGSVCRTAAEVKRKNMSACCSPSRRAEDSRIYGASASFCV